MAFAHFEIPANKSELLSESTNNYAVKTVHGQNRLIDPLKDARNHLREVGPEFILDHFDVYYSVLYHGENLALDVIHKAYEDLHRAITQLHQNIGFLMEDKDSIGDELKSKFVNVIKMLTYIYIQIVMLIEQKNERKSQGLLKRVRKKTDEPGSFIIDKKNILLRLNNILQYDINVFWEPPIVEESYLDIVAELCYMFLQNANVKSDKEARCEIFNLIGTLIKTYNKGTTVVIRLVQMISRIEHLHQIVPEGIQQLVNQFNCKGLVHDLIKEITEWQTDEKYADSQGARYCSVVISSMAVLMPDFMLPELMYLNKYLNHESPFLRISVLNVVTEVILSVLTSSDLSEEQREFRDDFLTNLLEHICDVSAQVRSKALQHWARLQQENAIPLKFVNEVLEQAVKRLYDKGALVRKSAANCITTFLSHNAFSANLSLANMKKELEGKQGMLDTVKTRVDALKIGKIEELEAEWKSKEEAIMKVIEEELEKQQGGDNEEEDAGLPDDFTKDQIIDMTNHYIKEGMYKEAFKLCLCGTKSMEELDEFLENNVQLSVGLYLTIFRSAFFNDKKIMEEIKGNPSDGPVTEDDFNKLDVLKSTVEFLEDAVTFLSHIDSSIAAMTELLETTTIGDMHEAVQFFTSAFHFNIDNAMQGITAMLKIMQRPEQERRDIILDAFKKIYLETDSKNMSEHAKTIVQRLIDFHQKVPATSVNEWQDVISQWVTKGTLDNSIIDMLWQFFTQRVPVSDEQQRASADVLKMAAVGRKTIVTKNIKLVSSIGLSEKAKKDLLLLRSACDLLGVAGTIKVDINSNDPPFRIKPEDQIFKDLYDVLASQFFEPVDHYSQAMVAAIEVNYKLCSKPEKLCEDLIRNVIEHLTNNQADGLPSYILTRVCQLVGFVALKQLEFLNETMYSELKRRQRIRDDRDQEKNKAKKKSKTKRKSTVNKSTSINTGNESSTTTVADESMAAETNQDHDDIADFILNVLEKDTVTSPGLLSELSYIFEDICRRPEHYTDVALQEQAVVALIRYMIVSSKYCQNNIQLLFTIFERTTNSEVLGAILFHITDLVTRFPNIVDPWTPRLTAMLKHTDIVVRRATFYTLANLILRDMVRAHSHLSYMACSMVDEDEMISGMCKNFFTTLSHKENNLYNALPDIFSHLVIEAEKLKDSDIKEIMKFLFDLMDKTKRMENLVDRFCCKLQLSEDIRQHRNTAYCLSLVTYNEKALRKLQENFVNYKNLLTDPEVYGYFKTIMSNCNKQQVGKADLKPIVAELEKCINSVFELNEDGKAMPPPPPPKSAVKRGGRRKGKRKKSQVSSDSDSD